MMLADAAVVVSELVAALGPWGTIVLLTGVGVLIGLWYIPWFQASVLSGADGPTEVAVHDDVERREVAAELDSVGVGATSAEQQGSGTGPVDVAFAELADVFAVVSDPDFSHPGLPREPTRSTFDGPVAVVSETEDPVVTPISVPTALAFDDLTAVVSHAPEPVVDPVYPPTSDSVDDPWDVGPDDTADPNELLGSSAVTSSRSDTLVGIDDEWEVGSNADARATERRQPPESAREAVADPVRAGTDGEATPGDPGSDGEAGSTALVGETSSMPRRKLLGAIAAIGGAAAFGGSGTTAFFGDTEQFANNTLVAGDLDLKVDWTEHYSDWSDDEAEGIDVSMEPGDGLVGFPSTAPEDEQSVFVGEDDVQTFLANTAIESFPDTLESEPTADDYDALQERLDDDICDLPADTDEALSHPFRTRGTFPAGEQGNAQTTAEGDPLVDITDLKPGDFGEVTFSFHLCGNPGYIWLTGALGEAAENGVTEPEGRSPNEEDGVVELLDAIHVALWYDTGPNGVYEPDTADKEVGEGDNFFGPGEQLIPLQGSLRNVLSLLESSMFPLDAEPLSPAAGGGGGSGGGTAETVGDTDDATIYNSTEDEPFASDSPSPSGPPKNFDCADYQRLLDDVGPLVGATAKEVDELLEAGKSFSACGGSVVIHELDVDGGSITVSTTVPIRIFSVKGGRGGENIYVWPESVYLEEVTLTTPTDQAISNVDVCCTVDGGGGGGQGDPNRQCFENSTTAYVGFEWWIPMDVGNEIQTDSISFDLGFYTEQCRHNDGRGMANRGG